MMAADEEEGVSPPCTDGSDLLTYLNSDAVRTGMRGRKLDYSQGEFPTAIEKKFIHFFPSSIL